MLLQSIHKKESASFDKLREIAPGFAFEADLWLSQGHTIQMKGPGDYPTALKCYEMAYDCMLKQNLTPQSKMLLNMGILYHSLGNLNSANEFVRRSLSPAIVQADVGTAVNPVFHRPENDVFYHWAPTSYLVRVGDCLEENANGLHNDAHLPNSHVGVITLTDESDSLFFDTLKVGDDIMVSDVLFEVLQVHSAKLYCKGFIHALDLSANHSLKVKKAETNFNHSTMTNCFALARIQEDRGHLQAAREIYLELLKLRPTYLECERFILISSPQ